MRKARITIDQVEVEVLEQATHPTRLVKHIEAVEEETRARMKEGG